MCFKSSCFSVISWSSSAMGSASCVTRRVALLAVLVVLGLLVVGYPAFAQEPASGSFVLVVRVPFFEDVAWGPVWLRLLLNTGLAIGLVVTRYLLRVA